MGNESDRAERCEAQLAEASRRIAQLEGRIDELHEIALRQMRRAEEGSRRILQLEGQLALAEENSRDQARAGVRLVAERERLLWLACMFIIWGGEVESTARWVLGEHGYDDARIGRMAELPRPVVPK